jgi:nicotinamidase-related amidase
VLQKRSPDAFYETGLQSELEARIVREIVLVGMQTELCIAATCRRAADLGYHVTLVADGHSTFDMGGQKAAETIECYNRELGSLAKVVPASKVEF